MSEHAFAQPTESAESAEPAASAELAEPTESPASAEPISSATPAGRLVGSAEPARPIASAERVGRAGTAPAVGSGVTGRGVVALIVASTLVGGLLDLVISGHRAFLFAIGFVVTSAIGAFVVRRRDLPTAVIAPPLVYCLTILIMSLIDRNGLSGSFSTRETYYVGNAFVTGAPAIWIGTVLAAGLGWYRTKRVP